MSDATRTVTRLIDLDDVQVDTIRDGQTLAYQESTGNFIGTLLSSAPGSAVPIFSELIGEKNNHNTSFNLPSFPDEAWPLFFLMNGVVQQENVDFVRSGLTLILTHAPESRDWLSCVYRPA